MPNQTSPKFTSPDVMRRAFQARLKSLDPRAERVLAVRIKRIGGFENQSYKLRYEVRLRYAKGVLRTLVLRGSNELQDQSRRQAYEIMKFLWHHGFQAGPYQIARPITFFFRWRLLIYQEVPGHTLLSKLRGSSAQKLQAIDRAARWLSALHRQPVRSLRLGVARADRQRYWNQALRLLQDLPAADRRAVTRVIRDVMRFEDRLASGPGRALVHHDFHPGNILLDRAAVRVVDFTESRVSHPWVDVGTFLAQLDFQLHARIRQNQLVVWQQRFLTTYQKVAPSRRVGPVPNHRILEFMRFRVALQSYLGLYLFGKREHALKKMIVRPTW